MACCKPCCGCRNCVENQKGKCCCGGANGSCCTEEQTCCANSCCDEVCCRGVCCQPGERCCPEGSDATQECCPPSRACCDGKCCPAGYSCVNGECSPCPDGYAPCGANCCPPGQACVDGQCVPCPEGQTPCGENCCTQEQTCCSEACCDNVCCDGVCCPPGQVCNSGVCCAPNEICGDDCCPYPFVCCDDECCDNPNFGQCYWAFDCAADGADNVSVQPGFLDVMGCVKIVIGAYDVGIVGPSAQASFSMRGGGGFPLNPSYSFGSCPHVFVLLYRNSNCETRSPDGANIGGAEILEYQYKVYRASCDGSAVDVSDEAVEDGFKEVFRSNPDPPCSVPPDPPLLDWLSPPVLVCPP